MPIPVRAVAVGLGLLAATVTLPTLGYVVAVLCAARPSRLPPDHAGAENDHATGSIRPISSGSRATRRAACRCARSTRIDSRKPFVPEEYTQLYYTPVYHGLHREHRLRYNQLFGVRINEYIMMLEADLVERLLSPLRRHPDDRRQTRRWCAASTP